MKLVATAIACLSIGAQAVDLEQNLLRTSKEIWNTLTPAQKTEIKTLIFDSIGQAHCLNFFSEHDDKGNEIMATE